MYGTQLFNTLPQLRVAKRLHKHSDDQYIWYGCVIHTCSLLLWAPQESSDWTSCQTWGLERCARCQGSSGYLGSFLCCYMRHVVQNIRQANRTEMDRILTDMQWLQMKGTTLWTSARVYKVLETDDGWDTKWCICRSPVSPLLLDFLNVFNTDSTASPGAERTWLFPCRAFTGDNQRLPGREDRQSVSESV